MGLFDHFPYTDYHRLNLDWILKKVKDLGIKVDSFEHSAIPTGGTTGQALVKKSAEDYDTDWATVVGERGPIGPVGPDGPPGPPGPKGEDGASFVVLGRYDTLEELQAAHPTGEAGDAYAVGDADDNVVYIWDVDLEAWNEIGPIQGPEGPQGPAGADGEGVPEGGTVGQVLAKASGDDYDTEWVTPQSVGSSVHFQVIFANSAPTQAYTGGTYDFPANSRVIGLSIEISADINSADQKWILPLIPRASVGNIDYTIVKLPTETDAGRITTITNNSISIGNHSTSGMSTDNTKGIVRAITAIYVDI